jgi:hypothetical protein
MRAHPRMYVGMPGWVCVLVCWRARVRSGAAAGPPGPLSLPRRPVPPGQCGAAMQAEPLTVTRSGTGPGVVHCATCTAQGRV